VLWESVVIATQQYRVVPYRTGTKLAIRYTVSIFWIGVTALGGCNSIDTTPRADLCFLGAFIATRNDEKHIGLFGIFESC
jgi:hypothetical protein